jgi:hypothetical protein
MAVMRRAEWDEKVRCPDSSIFQNFPEASEQLACAEIDLDKECKRLNKAIKRWARADCASEMDLYLRRLSENIAEHWSSLEELYELVESMLFKEMRLVAEMRDARKVIRDKVG